MVASLENKKMGRFAVDLELANNEDLVQVKAGHLKPDEVRRARVRGVVDSGATRLVIPRTVAKHLGVSVTGTTQVRYADGRTANREIVGQISLSFSGRQGVFSAVVEPKRESVLIGAIVMEELDLLIDCSGQCLVPRDPKQIISEVE